MRSLTEGHPAKLIILFTLPILGGQLFQMLYSFFDTYIAGQVLGVNGVGAIGCTTSLSFLITGFTLGITGAVGIIMAQRFGSHDMEGVKKGFSMGLLLSTAFGFLMAIVFVPTAYPLLTAMQTPAEIIDLAHQYIGVLFMAVPITMLYHLLMSVLRALGDSKSTLYFLILVSVCHILFDYLFMVILRLGTMGAAMSNVVSQAIACVACLIFIKKRYPELHLTKGHFRLEKKIMLSIVLLGLPMGLQQSIVEVGNIFVQTATNGLGALTVGAVSAAVRVRELNMLPVFCLGMAMATYAAQNLGAKRMDRVYSGMRFAAVIAVISGVIMAAVNLFIGDAIVSIFLPGETEAIALAHQYLIYVGFAVFFLGMMLIFRNVMQGLGNKRSPFMCGVMEMLMSLLCAFVLIPRFGFTGICLTNPLSWIMSGIPLYIAFVLYVRKYRRGAIQAAA